MRPIPNDLSLPNRGRIGGAGDRGPGVNPYPSRSPGGFEGVLSRNGAQRSLGPGLPDEAASQGSSAAHSGTQQATELSLAGSGYFAVAGPGSVGAYFVREGQFHLQSNGALVTASNLALLGRPVRPDGTLADSVGPLTLEAKGCPARATSRVVVCANLDPTPSAADVNGVDTAACDASTVVYDARGGQHPLKLSFERVSDTRWDYRVTLDGAELEPPEASSEVRVASGSLTFTSEGTLSSVSEQQAARISFAGDAGAVQELDFDFGDALAAGGSGLKGTTSFSMSSSVAPMQQDGYAEGRLLGVTVDTSGWVRANFSNAQTAPLGQLVVAQFRNPEGLSSVAGTFYAQTHESGQPLLASPGAAGRGLVVAETVEGASEGSDVPEVRVPAARHPHAFATSSRVMSAADDMLASLMLQRW